MNKYENFYLKTFSFGGKIFNIQLTLVISTSLISNNRLSRSENMAPVLTQRSTNRQQNIVKKRRNRSLGAISPLFHNKQNIVKKWRNRSLGAISPLFHNIFNISLT